MKIAVIFFLAVSNCALVFGQGTPSQAKHATKTQLEAFAAETGAVIIMGYTSIGKVTGMGSAEVDCREYTNASSGNKSFGISIKVTESGRLEREVNSFIDYDEIVSLVAGIDYILEIQPSVTKLAKFQATYITRGGFAVTVFNNSAGELSGAVSSGGIGSVSAYLTREKIVDLLALILRGKETLDRLQK